MPPVCSVCIANYNGISVLADCIDSVLEQTGDIPVEIIVHDDASTDESVAFIRRRYPDVTLVESPENVGFCVANNRMAARARGEYLLLLNNDAALFPDALTTLLDEARRLDRSAILSLPQYDAETGELLDIGSLLDPFLNPVPNRDPQRGEVGMVMGACLWLPKALWEELGGFPEWFGSIAEDMYLCCQARLVGHPVIALGESGYRHRVGNSFGGGKVQNNRLRTTIRRRAWSERNKTFTLIMCYPTPWMQLALPLHLGLLVLEGLLLSLLKRDTRLWRDIYWHCLREVWSKRRLLRQQRRFLQGKRQASAAAFFKPYTLLPHKLRMMFRHGLPEVK